MEELDLKYLQYALAVVRYGSVTQAARALYLAQPNLSRAIGELEQSLGFPLFLRTRQGMSLTPQGERFLTEVETLLERLGTYFAFRYLLKAVNDGDLLGQAQFCVLMVLTAQRLTAVCGFWEAVRRLCCEVEHSEENLEALRLAFLRDAALSPGAFLCQLRS